MKLVYLSILTTSIVVSLGVLSLTPAYLEVKPNKTVLLSFSITESENLPEWCNELSNFLNTNNLKAVVFVTGKVAWEFPHCVSSFRNGIDIGSQTYNYVELTKISDYLEQLDEIKNGKSAVDKAGNLNSKLFKAPNGATDENIYSLLSQAKIFADFSYENQYNKIYQEKFLKFDLASFQASEHDFSYFKKLKFDDTPIMINFDNSDSIDNIIDFILNLKSNEISFVNASELTGLQLTQREENLV